MVDEIKFDILEIVKNSPEEYLIHFGLYLKEKEGTKGNIIAVTIAMPFKSTDISPEKIEEKKVEFIKFFKSCAAIPEDELLEAYGVELPGYFFD